MCRLEAACYDLWTDSAQGLHAATATGCRLAAGPPGDQRQESLHIFKSYFSLFDITVPITFVASLKYQQFGVEITYCIEQPKIVLANQSLEQKQVVPGTVVLPVKPAVVPVLLIEHRFQWCQSGGPHACAQRLSLSIARRQSLKPVPWTLSRTNEPYWHGLEQSAEQAVASSAPPKQLITAQGYGHVDRAQL
ncbi:hypothetical protein RRG08_012645 [Elysia crispata]|uniref:Uncharacterized protein n=1 Tax=Elysia crispata TaxID=231223 RepID=A0AAE0YML4_9GAST|nr:hypothetical protein RRG08_012645 [Elysia crispata]